MTADFPGAVVGFGQDDFHNINSIGQTTLSGAITGTPATFTITSASAVTTWPTANFTVKVDNELIFVSSRSGTTLTVGQRGHDGTTSADHSNGATISTVFTAGHLERIQEEIIAIQTELGVSLGNVLTPTNTKNVTNKTLLDTTTFIADAADTTKKLQFDIGGTTGITGVFATAFTTAKTITFPNATDTLVGKATTDAFTNKTITDSSNSVRATELATTGASVVISGAAPGIAGQVLKLTSATAASWQDDDTGGGAGASVGASYLQLSLDGTNTAERVFTPGAGLTGTDGGAGSTYTIDIVAASGSNLVANANDLDWTGLGVQKGGVAVATRPNLNLIEGANVTITVAEDVANDRTNVTIDFTGGGGGGAPTSAQYLTLATDATLTQERLFVPGAGLTGTDGGAGGNYTLAVGAGTGITVNADDVAVNQAFSPTWTGTHTFTSATLLLPSLTSPAQTAEGSIAWDSDDNKLTVGDGASRQVMVNEARTISAGTGLTGGGDLSANRSFAIDSTVVTLTGVQALTNKELTDSTNTLGSVTMNVAGSDATGDIYYRNSGGLLTKLAIGTDGQLLTISGGLPSWASAGGGGWTYDSGNALVRLTTVSDDVRIGDSDTSSLRGKLTVTPDANRAATSGGAIGIWSPPSLTTNFSSSTFSNGNAEISLIRLSKQTITANSALSTTGATLHILGAPIASTNVTLSPNYALWVDEGNVQFDGDLDVDGALEVGGAFSIAGTTVFEADRDIGISLIPSSSNVRDLGSSSRTFRTGYFGTSIELSGSLVVSGTTLFESDRDLAVSLLPITDNTLDLGSSGRQFNDLFLGGTLVVGGTTVLEADRDAAISWLPNADNTLDLGSASRNWRTLYVGTSIDMTAANIVTDTTTGMQLWTATSQKGAFWGKTPVIQPASADQAAVATTGATVTAPFGYTTAAQANGIVTLLNEIRRALVEVGILKGAA